MKQFELTNKKILISGATGGIGLSCAHHLAEAGASLVLLGRRKDKLIEITESLKGENHTFIVQDLSVPNLAQALLNQNIASCGKFDGFLHCAGIESTIPLSMMEDDDYIKSYRLNVLSAFEISKLLSKKKFLNSSGSSFVFISSIMGILGRPGVISYCASKGALTNGAKAMALELVSKKIRVNVISPSVINTPMWEKMQSEIPEDAIKDIIKRHPFGIGKAEDIANASIYLLSNASSYITGTNLVIDGGYSIQ
jgi:NAD(P)-dependent dehydrogenase (short-subunit alcohol dehydrogenase family)